MKKAVAMILLCVFVLGTMMGCGKSNKVAPEDSGKGGSGTEKSDTGEKEDEKKDAGSDKAEKGKIEVEVAFSDVDLEKFRAIVADFEKESGITVELITPGSDYETVMKTRMASGDLPDVWVTHGWSVMRYSGYLRPLNDQPWFDRIDSSALNVISDSEDNIYVLPVSVSVSGVIYNKEVLKEAGIDPVAIHTIEDFEAACEKAKAIGKTPIYIGGKDSGNAAGFLGSVAPSYLTDEGCAYPNGEALKDGTFDWDTYGTIVMQKIADFTNKEYINKNFTTADSKEMQTALGKGDCAFVYRNTPNIVNARNYVPGSELGIIPIPSSAAGGKSSFKIGEGDCFGIWKDTKNLKEAETFLEYLSGPEVAKAICQINGSVPALKDVSVEDDYAVTAFRTAQEQFEGNIFYDNVFDREYFPSGMWSIMGDAVTVTVMDPAEEGIAASVKLLKENYIEKYEAAKNQ